MATLVERLRTPGSVKSWMEADAQRVEAADEIERLERENQEVNAARIYLREKEGLLRELKNEQRLSLRTQVAELEQQRDTAWAQAHRLALELECLLLDTKDNAVVSKWWDSGMEALSEYQELQPGAVENAEAWAAMRKAGV